GAWSGPRWQVAHTPRANSGSGSLSAWSGAATNTCVAVGSSNSRPLAESWNGTSWSLQLTPGPDQSLLLGVSCPAPHNCHAVGGYFNSLGRLLPLAELWNGGGWTPEAGPSPGGGAKTRLTAAARFTAPA